MEYQGKKFKGTEGEFEVSEYNELKVMAFRESIAELVAETPTRGDARLFANSKKLLEAAIEVIRASDFRDANPTDGRIEYANAKSNLDQAIKDCL